MSKPVDNVEIWAKDGVFTNGPFAGLDNKATIPAAVAEEGFIPGSGNPSAAEHVNDWLNRAAYLLDWVFKGSSSGAADEHIVETDSAGKTQLQRLKVDPTAGGGSDTVEIWGKVGIGQQYALTVEGQDCFGGAAYFNSPKAEALSAAGGPMSYAVWAIGWALGGGGVRGQGQGGWSGGYFEATDADAIQAWASGSGNGLQAHAGGGGLYGVWGDGNVFGDGLYGTGGSSSGYGVVGEPGDDFYAGVYGKSTATGQSSAGGVLGEGRGDAAGVVGYASGDGHGVAATSYGTRAPLLINARFDDPAFAYDGSFSVRVEGGSGWLPKVHSGEWRGLWSSRNGYAHLWVAGTDSSTSATAISVPATAFGAYNQPKRTGTVVLEWVGEVGRTGTCQITVDIVDVTGGVIVATRTYNLYQSGAGVYERTETIRHLYTLPAAGARTWRVDITKTGGGGADVARVRNNSLEVRGVYD